MIVETRNQFKLKSDLADILKVIRKSLSLIRVQGMFQVTPFLSLVVFGKQFVSFFCASAVEEASLQDGSLED